MFKINMQMKYFNKTVLRGFFVTMIAGILLSLPVKSIADNWIYTVKAGDTLWSISQLKLEGAMSWSHLLKLNGITNPKMLKPGVKLTVPMGAVKTFASQAVVVKVSGESNVFIASIGSELSIKTGMLLVSGDQITTGADGAVLLSLTDDSVVVIQENSQVKLNEISTLAEAQGQELKVNIQVERGGIEVRANPHKRNGSRYQIKSPISNTSVRGTTFSLETDAEATTMGVLSGLVDMENSHGKVSVPGEMGTKVTADSPPLPPVKLLAAPKLILPEVISLLPHKVKIPADAAAVQYEVKISPDGDFIQRELAVLVGSEFNIPATLVAGMYYLRVKAVDQYGLKGNPTIRTFIVEPPLAKPIVKSPSLNAVKHVGKVIFTWDTVQLAQKYKVEVSENTLFSQPLFAESLISTSTTTINLPTAGEYFFRLAGLSAAGNRGNWSETQNMTIIEALKAPILSLIHPDKGDPILNWNSESTAASYELELSDSPLFTNPLRFNLSKNTWRPRRPTQADYYVRVRALDNAGGSSPFSKVETLPLPPAVCPIRALFSAVTK